MAERVSSSNAPAALGAWVASLGVLELGKILTDRWDEVLVSRELFAEARHHRQYLTRLPRSRSCRFDHRPWPAERVDALSLTELLGPGDSSRYSELASPYPRGASSSSAGSDGASVVLTGCGNIGSHLVPQLARQRGVGRVVLVDPDAYEARNLACQDIDRAALRRSKVEVQAERLSAVAPELEVIALPQRLEDVPLGRFRGAILLGALDSRSARQHLNEVAFRVGAPWIDMAVDAASLACRISVYRPDLEHCACLECGWDQSDYELLEQVLPCEAVSLPAPDRTDRAADATASCT